MAGDLTPTTTMRCPVYVGRGRALEVIREVASAAGAPSVLLVGGEAGIGKSRLAAEAVAHARSLGHTVVEAACHAETSIPYEPIVALMRSGLRRRDRVETRELFAGTARYAATLLPEMAEAADPLQASDVDPQHVHAAVVEVLARLSGGRRGLLRLEDLHWASGDTVRLLTEVVRQAADLPHWIVATYRDDEIQEGHPLRPLLLEAQRSASCRLVHLGPLDATETATMVSAMLGAAASAPVVDRVVSRSSGNPLFVEELCARIGDVGAGRAEHATDLDLSAVDLPASVRESTLGRLAGMDPLLRDILVHAALAGETVDPALLATATGAETEAVDAAIAAGIDRQLIVERREAGLPVYAFRHALTREGIASQVSGPARRAAHRRIAAALSAGAPAERAGEAADHHAAAGDAAAARERALAAARFAARRGAAAESRRRYEQALRLAPSESERLETLLELVETLRAADPDLGPLIAEGMTLARSSADAVALARLLVVRSVMAWWRGDSTGGRHALAEAYELVRGRTDGWELAILLELSRAHLNRDETEPAGRLLRRGEELVAAGLGRPRDAVELLALRALLGRGDDERAQRYAAVLEAASSLGDPVMECVAVADAGFAALWWPGDLDRARALFDRAAAIAELVRPFNAVAYRAAGAWADAVAGDLDAAASAATAVLAQTHSPPSRVMALVALAEVHDRRGAPDRAAAAAVEALALAETTAEPQWIVPATAAVARTRLRRGLEDAAPLFLGALARGAGVQPHWYASPDHARALFAAGATERLRAWVERLSASAVPGDHRHDGAAWRLCAGLAALSGGDVDEARRLLLEARDAYAAMPCAAREAEALLGLAAAALQAGDRQGVVEAANAALSRAGRLGAGPLVDEARALLRRAGVRTQLPAPPGGTSESPLSLREREVAMLIAEGLSNAEIARRLYLSENTVERHVSNVLAKLGLSRRSQVAGWAASSGRGN